MSDAQRLGDDRLDDMVSDDPGSDGIDVGNYVRVCVTGEGEISIANPSHCLRMTKDQALRVAAWLVAIADESKRFEEILIEVQNP